MLPLKNIGTQMGKDSGEGGCLLTPFLPKWAHSRARAPRPTGNTHLLVTLPSKGKHQLAWTEYLRPPQNHTLNPTPQVMIVFGGGAAARQLARDEVLRVGLGLQDGVSAFVSISGEFVSPPCSQTCEATPQSQTLGFQNYGKYFYVVISHPV